MGSLANQSRIRAALTSAFMHQIAKIYTPIFFMCLTWIDSKFPYASSNSITVEMPDDSAKIIVNQQRYLNCHRVLVDKGLRTTT